MFKTVIDPLREIQWDLYRHEHLLNDQQYPQLELVASIISRYRGTCVVTGIQTNLCIVRFFPDLPICTFPWNAVLVARSLIQPAFPDWLAQDMKQKRKNY